jgi:hypothetical protein
MSGRRVLALRLLAAALAGVVVILGLEWWQRAAEAEAAAKAAQVRSAIAAAAAARPQVLDLSLQAESVVLCRVPEDVTEGAKPVLQLLRDGTLVIRQPAAPAAAPGKPVVPLLAIMLPVGSLIELSAVQRAALLDQLAVLLPERPVPTARLRLAGVAGEAADIETLLAWLR